MSVVLSQQVSLILCS